MSDKKGFFLTIEGIEGVGKSTALRFIQECLIEKGQDLIVTREPGGTVIAEQIRQVLLTPNVAEKMMSETELLLMFAARMQHVSQVILPGLSAGKCVVSDRFVDASFAYQGGGRGIDVSRIAMLEKWLLGDLKPDLTLLLDAPADVGLARAKHRGPQDRIEQEKIDFFERVRTGYLARMHEDPKRFRLIDATQSLEKVQAELKRIINDIAL